VGEIKNVRLMCRVLGVKAKSYYAWRKRPRSAHAIADERLLLNVRISHAASDGTYGAPRVLGDLRDAGLRVGQKRVARLLRTAGLQGLPRRRRAVRTTDSTHGEPLAPNLLQRAFDVNGLALNRVWVSDLTYVPTREGWLFLAVVLDLASRRVVGWTLGESLEAELAISALRGALLTRQPPPGLIHHSDRGVQYACGAYRALLAQHGIRASMSRRGDCWDNAVAESFFATLKGELLARRSWPTRELARRALEQYIDGWYNRTRRHSTLQYLSPSQYERRLVSAA
jgi:transposase InsO family protein